MNLFTELLYANSAVGKNQIPIPQVLTNQASQKIF